MLSVHGAEIVKWTIVTHHPVQQQTRTHCSSCPVPCLIGFTEPSRPVIWRSPFFIGVQWPGASTATLNAFATRLVPSSYFGHCHPWWGQAWGGGTLGKHSHALWFPATWFTFPWLLRSFWSPMLEYRKSTLLSFSILYSFYGKQCSLLR